jgi:hypothetical protein
VIAVREEQAAADLRVVAELLVGGGEGVDHREIERVPLLRSINADGEDMPLSLDGHALAHGPKPRSRARLRQSPSITTVLWANLIFEPAIMR